MAEERMLNDEILLGLIKANSGGGGGGTTDYDDLSNKPQIDGVTLSGNKSASDLGLATAAEVEGKQDALTAGANINMTGDVVKAGVVEVVEPDMTVYGNSTESGSKTYTIETTGVYEIFYCLSLQSTVSVTLPNNANVLFENDLTVSSHPVKHIVAELHEGDTVTIAQTPSQWNAVVSGVLKLDAISVVDVAHTGSVADNTITYTLPNDNKYYLVVGACVGKQTGNNAVDSTSGGTPEITRTLTGSGVRFRSVVVKGSDSPSFSFYGYDGGVASIIAYEIEFEEGNWDYNLATKNYVDTALSGKQDTLTFDTAPTDGSTNPVESNGVYAALATKANASDVTTALATKQDATDNNLQTTSKTVVGAVNELKSGLTDLSEEVNGDSTTYPYADVITIEDAVPSNLADCSVKIEPVQDLHGQSAPYVGGAGKNKLPLVLADLKANNTDGTWNGNVYTINNGTITVNTDADGNVVGIKANGTFSNTSAFILWRKTGNPYPFENKSYSMNGCPNGGSGTTYKQDVIYRAGGADYSLVTDTGVGANADFSVINDAVFVIARIVIYTGTYSDVMFYPMIRLATETDATFAPYTNICPISGHTEVSVQRDGKNLLVGSTEGATATSSGTAGYPLSTLKATKGYFPKAGKYTFSFKGSDSWGTFMVFVNDIEIVHYDGFVSGKKTITVPNAGAFSIVWYVNGAYTVYDPMIEYGEEKTDYEPYAGKTYTISLGDTIYGGTVDFDSGVMTVTHGGIILDGTETSKYSLIESGRINYDNADMLYKKFTANREISSSYTVLPQAPTNADFKNLTGYADGVCDFSDASTAGVYTIRIRDDRFTDLQTALNLLDTETPNFVFELATPLTVQLTPQQIQLLKGQNTLTASTGDISVTVNGVSGSIGAVQEQVNATDEALAELAEKLPTAPTTDGSYVLTVTVADGTPTYSWESAT